MRRVSVPRPVCFANGYLFRNETVLISTNEGVVDYRVKDGVKVSEGQALADVYAEGDHALREQIRRIDRQIELLEEGLSEDALLPDMAEIKADLREQYLGLVKQLADRKSVV